MLGTGKISRDGAPVYKSDGDRDGVPGECEGNTTGGANFIVDGEDDAVVRVVAGIDEGNDMPGYGRDMPGWYGRDIPG
jgi:hypothetical protein